MQYYVGELTVGQDELVAGILGEAGLGDVAITGILPANLLLTKLSEKKLLRRFLAVVAIPAGAEFDEDKIPELEPLMAKMKSTQMVEVVETFLAENAGWVNSLKQHFLQDDTGTAEQKKSKS